MFSVLKSAPKTNIVYLVHTTAPETTHLNIVRYSQLSYKSRSNHFHLNGNCLAIVGQHRRSKPQSVCDWFSRFVLH